MVYMYDKFCRNRCSNENTSCENICNRVAGYNSCSFSVAFNVAVVKRVVVVLDVLLLLFVCFCD